MENSATTRILSLILVAAGLGALAAALLVEGGGGQRTGGSARAVESPLYGETLVASLVRFEQDSLVVEEVPSPPAAAARPERPAHPAAKTPNRPVRPAGRGAAAAKPPAKGSLSLVEQGRRAFFESKWNEALSLFDRAIEKGEGDYLTYCYRADALLRLGRSDEALADYRRAYEMNPSFTFALHAIASIYLSRRQTDRAIETYREILRKNPSDKAALSHLRELEAKSRRQEAESERSEARGQR